MDWDFAIERHRLPLLALVLTLFAEIGLSEGGVVERLPRPLYRLVLGILRRAESAVRRLIVVAARDMVVEPSPRRPFPPGHKISRKGEGTRGASFQLFDPPQRQDRTHGRRHKGRRPEPRVTVIEYDPRIPAFLRSPAPAPAPVAEEKAAVDDGTVNAGPLCRRLAAIRYALEDLSRQARRLARRRARPVEERSPRRSTPLRTGRPPGFRQRQTHEVDAILAECHWLARQVPSLDTS